MFVETALDRACPLLQVTEAFSDQYLQRRIEGQDHKSAIKALPSIKDTDGDCVVVQHLARLLLQDVRLEDYSQTLYGDGMLPAVEIKYMPGVVRCPACLY